MKRFQTATGEPLSFPFARLIVYQAIRSLIGKEDFSQKRAQPFRENLSLHHSRPLLFLLCLLPFFGRPISRSLMLFISQVRPVLPVSRLAKYCYYPHNSVEVNANSCAARIDADHHYISRPAPKFRDFKIGEKSISLFILSSPELLFIRRSISRTCHHRCLPMILTPAVVLVSAVE